jgi:predicted GH43/DUF377 family glycosyl hydrolase
MPGLTQEDTMSHQMHRITTIVLAALIGCAGLASAQVPWVKHSGNPVLEVGPPGAFDDAHLWGPDVHYDGTMYHMWYTGESSTGLMQVGYATSPDGATWTKHPGNPVLTVGVEGEWDDTVVFVSSVVIDGGQFHMWYEGGDDLENLGGGQVGYAMSPDGIEWTKHADNPVLTADPDSWDHQGIWPGQVLWDGARYRMWYTSASGESPTPDWWRIGYAESSDGITWTTLDLPVLRSGTGATWDDWLVYEPAVVFDGSTYHMWYGGHNGMSEVAIGYATSPDGRHWRKYAGNPVLRSGSGDEWDGLVVEAPSVVLNGDELQMWFRGTPAAPDLPSQIGYATANAALPAPPMHLNSGRFVVELDWQDHDGNLGTAAPVQLTSDSGYFWFFEADNVEVTVKVLDACAISDRYWVFAAGMTNVGVTMTVTDTVTGIVRTYTNPVGEPFAPVLDTNAFETCDYEK